MNIDEYLAGIRQAADKGLIEYARTSYKYYGSRNSSFSHLEYTGRKEPHGLRLRAANTRELDPFAQTIIKALGKDVRFLELGAGAGLASADASRIPCVTRVETVGLTPIDPYARPRITRSETSFCFEECKGFIALQHIGAFPRETMPEGTFDFIYESFGPVYYESFEADYYGVKSPGREIPSLLAVKTLLSERGVFHSTSGGLSMRWNDHSALENSLIICCENVNDFFLLSRDHEAIPRLRRRGLAETRKNVALVPDLSIVVEVLTQRPCAGGKKRARRQSAKGDEQATR